MKWKNTLPNSQNVVMHLETLFTMSLVFGVFFFGGGGGGRGGGGRATSSLGCPDRF